MDESLQRLTMLREHAHICQDQIDGCKAHIQELRFVMARWDEDLQNTQRQIAALSQETGDRT